MTDNIEEVAKRFLSGQRMKVYFVETDDDDRERVISGVVENLKLDVERSYEEVYTDAFLTPVNKYEISHGATLTARLVPSENGTLFKVENFMEEEEQYDCEESD